MNHIYSIVLKDWKLVRHLVDNGAHGSIAFCSWGIFLCKTSSTSIPSEFSLPIVHTGSNPHVSPNSWCEVTHAWYGFVRSCLITGIMASLLDVDHFIAAGALSLTKAIHLHARPFGHTIAFIVFSTLVIWCYSLWIRDSRWTRIHRGCRVIIAFLSHQLRDGIRLGLWFWPFGSTPRVFYVLYIVLEIGLPIGLSFWQVTSLPSMGQARTFAHVQNDEEECHEV